MLQHVFGRQSCKSSIIGRPFGSTSTDFSLMTMHKVLTAQCKGAITMSDGVLHEHTVTDWILAVLHERLLNLFCGSNSNFVLLMVKQKKWDDHESVGFMFQAAKMFVWNFTTIHPITVPIFQSVLCIKVEDWRAISRAAFMTQTKILKRTPLQRVCPFCWLLNTYWWTYC